MESIFSDRTTDVIVVTTDGGTADIDNATGALTVGNYTGSFNLSFTFIANDITLRSLNYSFDKHTTMIIDSTTLLAIAMIFLGSFVQTAIGFGLAIISAPILIIIAPQYVPAPICLVALFISLLNSRKYRSSIELGGLKMAILGRIPGSMAGAALLVFVSAQTLSLWVGLLVLLAVFISIMPFRIEPTPTRMVFAGFFSGLFGTSSAIGGPPMAILLQHQEANQLRANLSAFFVFSSIISLTTLIPVGFLNLEKLWLTLPLLPAAWAGYWLALKTTQSLPKETIRYGALALCFICGALAVYKSIG